MISSLKIVYMRNASNVLTDRRETFFCKISEFVDVTNIELPRKRISA